MIAAANVLWFLGGVLWFLTGLTAFLKVYFHHLR